MSEPNPQELLNAATGFHQSRRFTEAVAAYRQLLEVIAPSPDVLHLLGVALYQSGDPEAGCGPIEAAIALDPTNADYYANYGNVLSALERNEDAVDALREAIKRDPRHRDATVSLGMIYAKLEQESDAEQQFREALAIREADPVVHNALGSLLQGQQRLDEGLIEFQRAVELSPDYSDALINLSNSLLQLDRCADAIPVVQRQLKNSPDDERLYLQLATAAEGAGAYDLFRAALRKAIELDSEIASEVNDITQIMRRQNNSERAQRYLLAILEVVPNHLPALMNLGNVEQSLHNFSAAIECYTKILDQMPDRHEARYNRAVAFRNIGKYDIAAAELREVIAKNPDLDRAYRELAPMLNRQGKQDEAAEVLHAWLKVSPDNPVACHLLAAAEGKSTPERAADEYLRAEFNAFASSFDLRLGELDYRGPGLVRDAVFACTDASGLNILDVGCGTGQCGELLRPRAARLSGVDLSSEMLAKAEARNVYDELAEEELTAYLAGRREEFDVITAGDTLNYFGKLDETFRFAHAALRDSGFLVFTCEHADDAAEPTGYGLAFHGRYRHTERYLRETLTQAGFEILEMSPTMLRIEAGNPVDGLTIRTRKTGA